MSQFFRHTLVIFALLLFSTLVLLGFYRRDKPIQWIAFHIQDFQAQTSSLMIMHEDGSQHELLANLPYNRSDPYLFMWSPDGNSILYNNELLGIDRIFILNKIIKPIVPIKANSGIIYLYPNWSPDGTRIIFVRSDYYASRSFDIFTIHPDGTTIKRLTYRNNLATQVPQWSPDGKWIIFRCMLGDKPPQTWQLCRISSHGSESIPITSFTKPSGLYQNSFAWSPDSKQIALNWEYEGLQIIHPDGSKSAYISASSFTDASLRWSPDGRWIIFIGQEHTIFRVNNDGTGLIPLTYNVSGFHPVWSPDGKWIVYAKNIYPDGVYLYKMRPDGSDQQLLSYIAYKWIGNIQFSPRFERESHLRELGLLAGGLLLVGLLRKTRKFTA